jgi:predicted AAA+ superfamily ATPase
LTSSYDDKIVVEVGKGNKSSKQVLKSMKRIGAPKGVVIGNKFGVDDSVMFIPWKEFLLLI